MENLKKYLSLMLISLLAMNVNAQELTQTIRGKVVDVETKFQIIGATAMVLLEDGSTIGTTSDVDGNYRLENVPVGRQTVKFSYLGYKDVELNNIIITSGKEKILNVEMEESAYEIEEVVVTAKRNGTVNNEMVMLSAREFSVEETERYAGSRGDPGRMASNFAGTQGGDDSRNDIIIRGNSPQGVLWRLDGFTIPNPNHFAIPGTGGGPVTILNNKFLANSDFMTGAFPAEYGNTTAGVFDLKMRNGNNEKHEFSGQLGFLGTELMAEGPLSKNQNSSYLATYRYSTLSLFSFLGINVGTDALPKYQDASFRINSQLKNGSSISVFGIGGTSDIDIVLSTEEAPSEETLIFGSNDRDQYFGSTMGILGFTYTHPVNETTYLKAGVSASHQSVDANHDYIFRRVENNLFVVDSLPDILGYRFQENKYGAYAFVNKKLGKKHTLKYGVNADLYDLSYIDSVRVVDRDNSELTDWRIRWNADNEKALLLQPYVQYKWKTTEKLTMTAGLTSTYYSMNKNSFSPIEPRVGMSYELGKSQKISFGAGMHSQIQPNYVYFYGQETIGRNPQEHNKNLGLTRSNHLVLAYDKVLKNNMRFRAETYAQFLSDIPVAQATNSFSLVNSGSGFSRFFPDTLTNGGTGTNYGVELTLEKFFSNGYYFLLTSSIFDSSYKGSDGVKRSTAFNSRFACNALFAKEFKFENNMALNLGAKVTYTGGRRYGPVDEVASARELEIIYQDDEVNTLQFDPYFRADAKIGWVWNRKKVTHEVSVDLVNIFNIQNILTLTYAPDNPGGPIQEEYQLGFLPLFFYKIDF